jgi:hypothetical protein
MATDPSKPLVRRVFVDEEEKIHILQAEIDGPDGLIVTFSDGTQGAYVVEELLELRPCREPSAEPRQPAPHSKDSTRTC